jgi:hypothetical protein
VIRVVRSNTRLSIDLSATIIFMTIPARAGAPAGIRRSTEFHGVCGTRQVFVRHADSGDDSSTAHVIRQARRASSWTNMEFVYPVTGVNTAERRTLPPTRDGSFHPITAASEYWRTTGGATT